MQDSPPQKKSFRSRVIAPALLVALGFLQSACAKEQVVVDPVAFSKVPADLKKPLREPNCDLDARAPDYGTEEIGASFKCWRQAYRTAASQYDGLRRAVLKREAAIDAAKAAAKR